MSACVNPNLFLKNTYNLLDEIKDDPRFDSEKLNHLQKIASDVQHLNLKNFKSIPSFSSHVKDDTAHMSKRINTYKRKKNSKINKQVTKVLSSALSTELDFLEKHAVAIKKSDKIKGGFKIFNIPVFGVPLFGVPAYVWFLLKGATYVWNPKYYMMWYGTILIAVAPSQIYTLATMSASTLFVVVQSCLTGFAMGTAAYQKYKPRNNIKDFLYESVEAPVTRGRTFVNVCLLTGLTGNFDVEYRLRKYGLNPKLITDLIDKLNTNQDDFNKILILPGILLSAYAAETNSIITEAELETLLCTCLGLTHPTSVQNYKQAFIFKEKFEKIMESQCDEHNVESKTILQVLHRLKYGLKIIHGRVFMNLPIKNASETIDFVINFIDKCIQTLEP